MNYDTQSHVRKIRIFGLFYARENDIAFQEAENQEEENLAFRIQSLTNKLYRYYIPDMI